MTTFHVSGISTLLCGARDGDVEARDQVARLVYDELRRIADPTMQRERPGHTLGATGLVHEAFIRLFGKYGALDVRCRGQFYASSTPA